MPIGNILIGSSAPTASDVRWAVFTREGQGSHLALLEGTLALNEGCLVVADVGEHLVVPVFPKGEVSFDEGRARLVVPGHTYELGSVAVFTGGSVAVRPGAFPEYGIASESAEEFAASLDVFEMNGCEEAGDTFFLVGAW